MLFAYFYNLSFYTLKYIIFIYVKWFSQPIIKERLSILFYFSDRGNRMFEAEQSCLHWSLLYKIKISIYQITVINFFLNFLLILSRCAIYLHPPKCSLNGIGYKILPTFAITLWKNTNVLNFLRQSTISLKQFSGMFSIPGYILPVI